MKYSVVYASEASQNLADIYTYLADAASPEMALEYVTNLVNFCDSFAVDGDCVRIAGFFHGGRDYEGHFQDAPGVGESSSRTDGDSLNII